jgi:RNA polymerase-interacting CarD/CdnL/TRCF family regulator
MFAIGAYVSYRSEGVCVISDIRTEVFNSLGKSEEYYILAPLKDMNSVLYVPVNNEILTSKMQPLLSADEICALADELRGELLDWIDESRARNAALREILSGGDRRELIVLVNTILDRIARSDEIGRKITAGDENTLKRAKRMLLDEFSATTDLTTDEQLMGVLAGTHRCNPRAVGALK